MSLNIRPRNKVETVVAWVDDRPGVKLVKDDDTFRAELELAELAPGDHAIILAADGNETGFYSKSWTHSHPLYVVVSTDWDDSDNSENSYQLQQDLHDEHGELILTHFIGPYTFTDPEVDEGRRAELAQWGLNMEERYGDEIGLHIHPYCNFVERVGEVLEGDGVSCRDVPSTVYSADATGYTVMVSAYEESEMIKMFQASDRLFQSYGLPKPTSFRAGGWTADMSTLRAMAQTGYVADTSANNWSRMEEWEGVRNGVLYDWNREQWSTIGDTSQPYYPSQSDILVTGESVIPVLEVPDNGILVDYVTTAEMIEIFDSNWKGGALDEAKAYSIGYHPPNFNQEYKRRITDTLTYADQFLASKGTGPVVYARLSDLISVWPLP